MAEQETDILKIEIEQAKAAEQAAYQTYLALKNGSRPEDIAKAEAAVLVAQSRLHLAQKDFERVDGIFKSTKGQGVSKQSLDTQSSQRIVLCPKELGTCKDRSSRRRCCQGLCTMAADKSASCPIRIEVKAEYVVCAPRHNGSFEAPSAGGHG